MLWCCGRKSINIRDLHRVYVEVTCRTRCRNENYGSICNVINHKFLRVMVCGGFGGCGVGEVVDGCGWGLEEEVVYGEGEDQLDNFNIFLIDHRYILVNSITVVTITLSEELLYIK